MIKAILFRDGGEAETDYCTPNGSKESGFALINISFNDDLQCNSYYSFMPVTSPFAVFRSKYTRTNSFYHLLRDEQQTRTEAEEER